MPGLRKFVLATAALVPLACAAPEAVRPPGYCAPPAKLAPVLAPDAAPPTGASLEERIAALLGLSSVLAEHPLSEASRLRAVERIELARLAIAATAAELDCEGERAEQAADVVSRAKSRGVQELTIASIGAAAATGIASVFLSTHGASALAQDSVAIGGGVGTAAFAIASLYVRPRIPFRHARNLLADVWRGPTVSLYPPIVWAYLSRPEFSNAGSRSIRENLVDRWLHEQGLGADPSLASLLFGDGGAYDLGALRTRAAMLDEVKAEVALENQDIASLAAVLLRD